MLTKKILTSLVILLSSNTLLAGTMGKIGPAPISPEFSFRTGPYLGASIGSQINATGLPAVYTGVAGTLFGGWGTFVNHTGTPFYLGAEVYVSDNAQTYERPNRLISFRDFPNQVGSVKSSWRWGVDVMPGVLLTDNLLAYFRGGFVQEQFNVINTTRSGWSIGGGGQANIYKQLDLRLEYVLDGFNISNHRVCTHVANLGFALKFS